MLVVVLAMACRRYPASSAALGTLRQYSNPTPEVCCKTGPRLGLANRLCAPAATRIALSTPLSYDTLRSLWRRKATVSRNPVRGGVLNGDRSRAVERFASRGIWRRF